MTKKSVGSIADLILKIRLGQSEVPDGVDREGFLEYLEGIHNAEMAALERSDRIFTKKQAQTITVCTVVMAICAFLALMLDLISRG